MTPKQESASRTIAHALIAALGVRLAAEVCRALADALAEIDNTHRTGCPCDACREEQ